MIQSEQTDVIKSAHKFCRITESYNGQDNREILNALISLLYHFNLLSQHHFSGKIQDLPHLKQQSSFPDIPNKVFSVIFDPLDPESACEISLRNCLEDIYNELKPSLEFVESLEWRSTVLQDWQISFQTHWNRHLIDAIRFLMLK